jgi:hypothetical protein
VCPILLLLKDREGEGNHVIKYSVKDCDGGGGGEGVDGELVNTVKLKVFI